MGQSLVFMPECHSTNDEALQLYKAGKGVEGSVVITDNQIAGRGQRSNTWESEAGKNLTFSILLTPHFMLAKDQFYITICVSIAIAEYLLEALGENAKIKWPNDLLVRDKKVCGILIENQVSGQHIQSCIVGIGLNVNQQIFGADKASSMKLLSGREFVLADELPKILEKIESRYLLLRQGQRQKLFSEYVKHMYWLREKHFFLSDQKEFEGMISGVDEIGRLNMATEEGIKVFGVKEVQFLR
jgi:BirA family biotin operon repressor/biotin-[acetyl-CoA-carboxylase] ligase